MLAGLDPSRERQFLLPLQSSVTDHGLGTFYGNGETNVPSFVTYCTDAFPFPPSRSFPYNVLGLCLFSTS